MKLFEHGDFEQAILAAAEHFRERGWTEAFIEKDYYSTEALRVIADEAGDKIIFKGGTSLSKGWNIVQRFSEDLDIFVDPEAFEPVLRNNAIDRELKRLRKAIENHPGFTFLPDRSRTYGGSGRNDYFEYQQLFAEEGGISNQILCEVGTASGRLPSEQVEIYSYLGQYLHATANSLGCEDEGPFTLRLLHYRRTFVEKLFAIHAKVEFYVNQSQPLGSYSRHYYDLYQLSLCPQVEEMLQSNEYNEIKEDYERISQAHFERGYVRPENMSFASSQALFPEGKLAQDLGENYRQQCDLLCFGEFPAWDKVLERFRELRHLL